MRCPECKSLMIGNNCPVCEFIFSDDNDPLKSSLSFNKNDNVIDSFIDNSFKINDNKTNDTNIAFENASLAEDNDITENEEITDVDDLSENVEATEVFNKASDNIEANIEINKEANKVTDNTSSINADEDTNTSEIINDDNLSASKNSSVSNISLNNSILGYSKYMPSNEYDFKPKSSEKEFDVKKFLEEQRRKRQPVQDYPNLGEGIEIYHEDKKPSSYFSEESSVTNYQRFMPQNAVDRQVINKDVKEDIEDIEDIEANEPNLFYNLDTKDETDNLDKDSHEGQIKFYIFLGLTILFIISFLGIIFSIIGITKFKRNRKVFVITLIISCLIAILFAL